MEIVNTPTIKYEDIIELIKLEWPKEFGEVQDNEMIEKMYDSTDKVNDVNLLLIEDDKIIGWCRYTSWPKNDPHGQSIHLLDIAIDTNYRKKGYGTILMQNMISSCRKNGNDCIYSRTFQNNLESQILHKKNGFIIDFTKDDSIVWKLIL